MRLLLFDLDATLVLTGGSGLLALNRAFKKLYKIDNAMDGIAPHGKTDPIIIREIYAARLNQSNVDIALISSVIECYLTFLQEEVERSQTYRVLPGIRDFLINVGQREGILLGLATGNVELGARIKLQRGELNRFFEFGGFGSDSENRVDLVRCAADRGRRRAGPIADCDIFVIGDTPLDVRAGKQAGFRTVGVATGHYSVSQLIDSGADIAIPDFLAGRDHFLRSTCIE